MCKLIHRPTLQSWIQHLNTCASDGEARAIDGGIGIGHPIDLRSTLRDNEIKGVDQALLFVCSEMESVREKRSHHEPALLLADRSCGFCFDEGEIGRAHVCTPA